MNIENRGDECGTNLTVVANDIARIVSILYLYFFDVIFQTVGLREWDIKSQISEWEEKMLIFPLYN